MAAVDQAGGVTGAETIVDVDDGDAAGAGIKHRQQRGDAAETGTITDARRHSNDRFIHESADNTRQRAFHTGNDDEDIGGQQFFVERKKAVDAGNADIVVFLNMVAHDFSGHDGFLGNRDIGRAGAKDGNHPSAFGLRLEGDGDGASRFVIPGFGESAFDGPVSFLAGAGGEEIVTVLENCAGNLDDLRG